jgi:hypothetical protein
MRLPVPAINPVLDFPPGEFSPAVNQPASIYWRTIFILFSRADNHQTDFRFVLANHSFSRADNHQTDFRFAPGELLIFHRFPWPYSTLLFLLANWFNVNYKQKEKEFFQ